MGGFTYKPTIWQIQIHLNLSDNKNIHTVHIINTIENQQHKYE